MARYLFTRGVGRRREPSARADRRPPQAHRGGGAVTVLGNPVTEREVRAVGVAASFRPWVRGAPSPTPATWRMTTRATGRCEIRSACWRNLMDALRWSYPTSSPPRRWPSSATPVTPTRDRRELHAAGSLMAAEATGTVRGAGARRRVVPAEGCALRDRVPAGAGPARTGTRPDRPEHAFQSTGSGTRACPTRTRRGCRSASPAGAAARRAVQTPSASSPSASAAFNYQAALPANVRYVGPQLNNADEPAVHPPDGDDRPFVLVAMSTTFMDHVEQLQRAVTALGSLPCAGS